MPWLETGLGEYGVWHEQNCLDYERPARNLAVLRGTTMLSSPLVARILNKLSPRLGSEFGC